ncbi:hypothetical protein QBC36DRAFT_355481 [Triangularia setosa]|uniref:Uncharacterized protein n=1 Tax=Triangularia setosa TaxID=2587417 RepID=A0AAN6W6N4_9PEZI|nr:hypothetical protein QBC36DRAFT_355481 [Podospora setosa]
MYLEPSSYTDFVKSQSQTSPCLIGLVQYLGCEYGPASTIVAVDYTSSGQLVSSPQAVAETDLARLVNDTSTICGQVLLVENVRPRLINLLGEILDLDPVFFASHIITDFKDIEKAPPPPSLALFPSQIAQRGHLHLHYQQVLGLGSADAFQHSSCTLTTDSNVPRNVRCLPHLSGRQLALARACCSVALSMILISLGLVLVDSPIRMVVETQATSGQKLYASMLLNGGFEDVVQTTSSASFRSFVGDRTWDKRSMLGSLLHYFGNRPPGFIATQPSKLSLYYYSTRIALAEWVPYTHLMNIENRLHGNDIVDLQRWRRRSVQGQHKLGLLTEFVDYWLPQEADKQPWNLVLKDSSSRILRPLKIIKRIEPMLFQALNASPCHIESANVSQLTFIVLVFVPLSWAASLSSMSEKYSPGHEHFWAYFATALPVLILVLLLSALQWGLLARKLKEAAALLSWRPRHVSQEVVD